jgi:predicted transcriptional regulator
MNKGEQSYLVALGAEIHKRRRVIGINQEVMADKVGIARTHLIRIEAGQVATTVLTLRKIAKQLGVKPEDLLKNL